MTYLIKILLALASIPLLDAEIVEWWDPIPGLTEEGCTYSYRDGEKVVECEHANDTTIASSMRCLFNKSVCRISISNSEFSNIPKGTFWHVGAHIVEIHNTVIQNFTLFEAFDGMHNVLTGIIIRNVSVEYWLLSAVEEFPELQMFDISDCPEEKCDIGKIIGYMPEQICQILICKCNITLEKFFFRRFENLQKLKLSDVKLKFIRRDYLPESAKKLYSLDLSFNPITHLPTTLFQDLPALRVLSLQGTSLTILYSYIFRPVVRKLHFFNVEGNPLTCGCNNAWLLIEKHLMDLSRIKCSGPPSLINSTMAELLPIDMCLNCVEFQRNSANE